MPMLQAANAHSAIVACPATVGAASARYLRLASDGAVAWEADPEMATPFESMREAARAALRLPAALRAFGLPRHAELMLSHSA
ncbi:MAG: hypothetical protein JSR86_02730 [Proteobacteria bacterium]|nr:hypothetical protein [Pseudomonadota bacterium]